MRRIDVNAMLRSDFYGFIERSFYELNPNAAFFRNWHIEVIAQKLEDCRRGKIKRLIINVPPRSLKSHCASVAFPAWLLGHDPSAQIICASYAQDLANKLSSDCRSLMQSDLYRGMFKTRLSHVRQAVQEFVTTLKGFRLATSVGGVLTGRGADFLILDDPLKPDEALSETQRKSVNDWYDHTLLSRLNDKRTGCIIVIMQRLHEDDIVGHLQEIDQWEVLKFPAIAEEDESYVLETSYGQRTFERHVGDLLHAEREPLAVLESLKRALGEYNFAGQYQQAPAPLGGGMIKGEWFKTYTPQTLPEKFEIIFQSWDTANKATELADYSACTTWGFKKQNLYLLHVFRKKLDYPALKQAVRDQAQQWNAKNVIIEDKASGTQLIQELIFEGMHGVKKYDPEIKEKIMRMHAASSTIENGFVHLPEQAEWLSAYLHELKTFPLGKNDDQVDSTSQALDWIRLRYHGPGMGIYWYYMQKYDEAAARGEVPPRPDLVEF